MRTRPTQLIVAVLALGLLTFSLGPAQANELLAGGSLQDLIRGGGQNTPKTPAPAAPGKSGLTKANLGTFIQQAGYQPKDLGDQVFEITVKSGDWTIPIIFLLSNDETVLWLSTNLMALEDESQVPVVKMLALLAANREHGPYFFRYAAKHKKLQLALPLPNKNMTPAKIKLYADHMVTVALKYEPMWNPKKWGQSSSTAKHIGSWVASTQQMSYRLTLNADGTFTLATQTHQGTNSSKGRFTLADNQLTLQADDGSTLKATMLWTAADTFVFKIEGSQGNALTFKRG